MVVWPRVSRRSVIPMVLLALVLLSVVPNEETLPPPHAWTVV